MTYHTGCLICGKDLNYKEKSFPVRCEICGKNFESNVVCENNHYICDLCHSKDSFEIIKDFCLTTKMEDPLEMAVEIMKHPYIKMHGPEHHFVVPAVLLTSYYIYKKERQKLPDKLEIALKRAKLVPGGFCGTHGNCGAAVGTGIFISIISGATSVSHEEWQNANLLTAKTLYEIALMGGPRCCKRDSFIAIIQTVKFLKEKFYISLPINEEVKCSFRKFNKECIVDKCKFFNKKLNIK